MSLMKFCLKLLLFGCMPCGLVVSILGQHMQFDVSIRLYEYWHEQVKIRKRDEIIKK
jgi:hypothetical protein